MIPRLRLAAVLVLASVGSARADEPAPKTAAEAIRLGVRAVDAGKNDEAIALFDKALALDPKSRKAALLLTTMTQVKGGLAEKVDKFPTMLRSAAAARVLRSLAPDPTAEEAGLIAMALYNEACAYARTDKPAKAIASLNESIDAGFDDPETLEKDEDLDSLRSRPDFAPLPRRIVEGHKAAILAAIKASKPFPFDFALPDPDGKVVKLSDFKGKLTIVDIWGTWCPPCLEEVPHLIELKAEDKDLAIVGINYEQVAPKDVNATIRAFVKEKKVNYPCLAGDDKTQDQVPNFQGYPTTLFLDREGKVRHAHVGYATKADLQLIVKTIRETP